MAYQPLYIRKMEEGLVQSRQQFILPDDAYPILQNVLVWREQLRRRQGLRTLGRLQRNFTDTSVGVTGASPWSFNIFSSVTPAITEANAQIVPGTVIITITGPIVFTDQGDGTLTSPTPGNSGTIDYLTGDVTLTHTAGAGIATVITFSYNPNLPVMGLRGRELNGINVEQLIAFDTTYAYRYLNGWAEFIAGTTWTGNDAQFFWSTNYWVDSGNTKIFWVTNFSGVGGDPIRYTNGTSWIDFAPQINASGDVLAQCLTMLPFRGRMVTFNTFEGPTLAGSTQYRQRIRWAAIGNPFTTVSAIITDVNANAWRDDIRGQGGFLDIPTAENITAVGFVRDNLVVYCERSTWQLRYTGQSIAPFQIERVNSELGAESTFSAVQFDTSLVGIGDKGVVECDSFKSERIDIKIPDLVFEFKNEDNGTERVHGIRDIQQRTAYWTYVYNPGGAIDAKFPNRRLVYNYENKSWAIYTDSLTTLGFFQNPEDLTWAEANFPWSSANFPWLNIPAQFPSIVGGNQQGFVMYLSNNLYPKTSNDPTLYIQDITGNTTTATVIRSPDHNLETGDVITISGLLENDPFASTLQNPLTGSITGATNAFPCVITSTAHGRTTGQFVSISDVAGMTELNGNIYRITVIEDDTFSLDNTDSTDFGTYSSGGEWSYINAFGVVALDADTFELYRYSVQSLDFTTPQLDPSGVYLGGGVISVRNNFIIQSKKFNFLDQGQNIQLGFVDALVETTSDGSMTLQVYLNYDDTNPINTLPQNVVSNTSQPDPFFNAEVLTSLTDSVQSSKNFQRVFCNVRGNFVTLLWTLSKEQMTTIAQESPVQIDNQILWIRPAGTQLNAF